MTAAPASTSAAPPLEVDGVSVVLGGRRVLSDISFRVEQGRLVGIIGPNGAGKTTLLRVILGFVRPERGSVRVFGVPPGRLGRRAHHIGYLPQRPGFDVRFPIMVRDVVMMGRLCCLGLFRWPGRRDWERVEETLAEVGLEGVARRLVGELSRGEMQRVLLARALCAETRLLLLDEPTTALDMPTQEAFYRLLKRLREERGLTVVVVSHDLMALGAHADELACISGTMHIHGNPQTVLRSDQLREAYRCEFDFLSTETGRPVGRHRA